MAAADPRQHLLALIRDFAQERSQGERRVSDLRKRTSELAPALDAAAAGLEAAKGSRETAEQELRCAEFELALSDAAAVAHESRISLLQGEISKIGAEISSLKNEEDRMRDEFIKKMSEFNKEIRKFHDATRNASSKDTHRRPPSADDKLSIEDTTVEFMSDGQEVLKKLENEIAVVHNQTHTLELECLEDQDTFNKVLQEVADMEKRVLLMESIAKEMKELQELARQIAESEQQFAVAVQELQRRYTCPKCQTDNMGKMDVAMVAE